MPTEIGIATLTAVRFGAEIPTGNFPVIMVARVATIHACSCGALDLATRATMTDYRPHHAG
jgi:hypothetical protein